MKLNLTSKGILSKNDSKLIDEIYPEVVKKYNDFIIKYANVNNLSPIDILNPIFSRNPYQSSILDIILKLELLEIKLKQGEPIDVILIDNSELEYPIKQILKRYKVEICLKKVDLIYSKEYLLVFKNLFKSIIYSIVSILWPLFLLKKQNDYSGKIVFVDTFIFPHSFNAIGCFQDRYFTGFKDRLEANEKDNVYFSPVLIGFRSISHFVNLIKNVNISKDKYIFQESWLRISDYFWALYKIYISYKNAKKIPKYSYYEIDELVKKDIRNSLFSPYLMVAYCRYRFIKKISIGIGKKKICKVIDWNENQIIDKAMNLGFNEFFPGINLCGYLGHVSSTYETHKVPLKYEFDHNLIPKKCFVLSGIHMKFLRENCPFIEVEHAYPYRYASLFNDRSKQKLASKINILIGLPISVEESDAILNTCIKIKEFFKDKIELYVKHHPSYQTKDFAKYSKYFLNKAFIASDKNNYELLKSANFLITVSSAICIEAAYCGVKVLIAANNKGVTNNPLDLLNDNRISEIFYDDKDLIEAISQTIHFRKDNVFPSDFFYMNKEKTTRKLFMCEDNI